MKKSVTLSSFYNFESGYSEILSVLLSDLDNYYNIIPRSYTPINERYLQYFEKNHKIEPGYVDINLLSLMNGLTPTNVFLYLDFSRKRLLYTMWESTRINDLMIEILNKYTHIMVPCNYNKINFINQGLTTNIDVVPLFCDTDCFCYSPHKDRRNFVFGISNQDPRKNLNKIIKCFLKAFKNYSDVELQIKTTLSIDKYSDSKLKYISKKMSKEELRDWYYDLDVYVSGATCEGWGMMQQESMCCGRPIITQKYGGISEFVDDQSCFEIGYDEVYSQKSWGDFAGKWSEFKEDELIETMLYCYKNKNEVFQKGILASNKAKVFTKDNFIKNVVGVVNQYV